MTGEVEWFTQLSKCVCVFVGSEIKHAQEAGNERRRERATDIDGKVDRFSIIRRGRPGGNPKSLFQSNLGFCICCYEDVELWEEVLIVLPISSNGLRMYPTVFGSILRIEMDTAGVSWGGDRGWSEMQSKKERKRWSSPLQVDDNQSS